MKVLDFLDNAIAGALFIGIALAILIGVVLVIASVILGKQYQQGKKQQVMSGIPTKRYKKWGSIITGILGTLTIVITVWIGISTYIAFKPEPSIFVGGSEKEIYNRVVDAFLAAVDARDKEAIKELFAPSVLAEDEDIDESIDQLFAFYSGPTDSWERDKGLAGRYTNHYGDRRSEVETWFPVFSGETAYYCYLTLVYENDENKDEIGIVEVDFLSEKVKCSEEIEWSDDLGLNVMEDAPGDYLTRRIGGYPKQYTPTDDRLLTEEDFTSFLEESKSLKELIKRFGKPNVYTPPDIDCAYEIEEENGKNRYVDMWVDGDTITQVTVVNEEDTLRTLLKYEKD